MSLSRSPNINPFQELQNAQSFSNISPPVKATVLNQDFYARAQKLFFPHRQFVQIAHDPMSPGIFLISINRYQKSSNGLNFIPSRVLNPHPTSRPLYRTNSDRIFLISI